ncbi:hypothetical protein HMPREF9477_00301 [Lachnospiraceae bacterium 2_1_46FAA]|nr:hypothetical protein HMPREF9477_00301 [Lachnospiraceae bacterium 2_1_46FAA]
MIFLKKAILYIHGKDGNANEAEHYKSICSGYDIFGMDYSSKTPWEAKEEFPVIFDTLCGKYDSVIIIANSIGAFFAMNALQNKNIKKALFISPIVNMEKLIGDMMAWANVTETELCDKKEIPTEFGETLSWKYLCYVRKNPIDWKIPTNILFGTKDNLTSYDTVSMFADKIGATLTIMENGEHWFHTNEQIEFLDNWLRHSI